MQMFVRSAVVALVSALAVPAFAAPVVRSSAVAGQALAPQAGCYQMGLGYDPALKQYYGGGGGNPSCNGTVWNEDGAVIQNISPIGVDLRSVYFNPNTGNIETLTYGAKSNYNSLDGLVTLGRDTSGLYTGNNSVVLPSFTGQRDDSSVAAYDADRDLLYTRANNNIVWGASRSDGSVSVTIELDLSAAGASNVQFYGIAFDLNTDTLIVADYLTAKAHVFEVSGAYVGSSTFGGAIDDAYGISFANGQLFLANRFGGGWQGFSIFEPGEPGDPTEVPEPASFAILLTGLALTFARGHRRRRLAR